MPSTIRVLVVDDSALIRQMLTRALSMDPRIEIVGTAKTGVEAIERARELDPDVVTLDIEMPELTGLEALPHICRHTRARVVMLSSLDDPDTTYRALSSGAVDFIPKPSTGMASSLAELTDTLLKKIKMANRISPDRAEAIRGALEAPVAPVSATPTAGHGDPAPAAAGPISSVVAIAASTGGPPALERVLAGLSANMGATYLIVQHLPKGFSTSLARRLNAVGDLTVVEAVDGMPLEPGRAYLAPYGRHMVVDRSSGVGCIAFVDAPPLHGVRPAADVLFDSVATAYHDRGVAVVLTGMGSDGAVGARKMRDAGGEVVVQDEPTSVVWGMPGAAVREGASARVVPLGLVAAEIRRAVRMRAGDVS